MKGTMLIIPPTGPIETVELAAPADAEAIHKTIGGYLEAVPHWHTFATNAGVVACVAFCNEDGKPGLPYNSRATIAWANALKRARIDGPAPDYLAGTIVVLYGDSEFMESL